MTNGVNFVIALLISAPGVAEVSRDCSNRQAVNDMIRELKDAFECAGLSASDCKKLVSGTIGGALAARMAVGLRVAKRLPAPCLGNLDKTALNSEIESPIWLFLPRAYALSPNAPIIGCTLNREQFGRDLASLSKEYKFESEEIRRAMALRLTEDVLKKDMTKTIVTDQEIQKAALEKLKEFQRAIENPALGHQIMGGDTVKLQMMRDMTKTQIEILSKETDNLINAAMSANERIFFSIPDEAREAWEKKLNLTQTIREQTNIKIEKEGGARAKKAFEHALEHLNNKGWESDKRAYLRGQGYSEDAVNEVLRSERTMKDLNQTRLLFDDAQMRLSIDPEFKELRSLDAPKMSAFMKKYLPQIGHRIPITQMAEIPGAAVRLQARIMAMGRAQLASMASHAAHLKEGMGLAARAGVSTGRFALGTGGTILTFSMNAFAAECRQMGERQSPYVTLEAGPAGGCVASSRRSENTDSFLFALDSNEQWELANRDPQVCTMLNRTFEHYAPSRQWQVQCPTSSDGEIVLESKDADPNQLRIRFQTKADGEPKNVDWIHPAQSTCIAIKNGVVDTSKVFTLKDSAQKSCEHMGAGSMDSYQPTARPTDRKFVKQFADTAREWVATNNYTFTKANDCCAGKSSPLCPSKNKASDSAESQTQSK